MRLYWRILKLLFRKVVLRRSTGVVVRDFAMDMGIVYIKLAQILATQNYGRVFTEADRVALAGVCDDCKKIEFDEIERILQDEYGEVRRVFRSIQRKPVGSASVSQVHRGVLMDGTVVAIKVKRADVTRTMEKDIARIRRLVHRFGGLVKLRNFTGGDRALDLYLEWIRQETDFRHEVENLKLYQEFAMSVEGQVAGAKRIRVPQVFEELCTENVIVMQYVETPTINRCRLTPEAKREIAAAMNDYLRLSFWAMFHDRQVVFHGDPHGGNVAIDKNGDVWFLDMGLLCVMSGTDVEICRKMFLAAYTGNGERLYELLVGYGNMDAEKQAKFRQTCVQFCQQAKGKDVTHYFVDMMTACLDYEFVPPDFLFSMAKAFVCLNGIAKMVENKVSAQDLLQVQIAEFMMRRSLEDCREIIAGSAGVGVTAIENALRGDFAQALAGVMADSSVKKKVNESIANFREMLELV